MLFINFVLFCLISHNSFIHSFIYLFIICLFTSDEHNNTNIIMKRYVNHYTLYKCKKLTSLKLSVRTT